MMKAPTPFLRAADVAEILQRSPGQAYKIIKKLNAELEKQGYLTEAGRISRAYFNKRFGLEG